MMPPCRCGNPLHHALPSGRRGFLAAAGALACTGLGGVTASRPARAAAGPHTDLTADQALELMQRGNRDFVTDAPFRTGATTRERRIAIAAAQTPFCVLLGCSDSRVSPELLFGRGLGELFIVRNAGNVVDLAVTGSIEYAVAELGVPLVVVLGHQRCGAVSAAVSVVQNNTTFPGSIGQMVEPIVPAVLKARTLGGDLLDQSVRENVRRVAARLPSASSILQEESEKRIKIVGAYYDLDDGKVEFFT